MNPAPEPAQPTPGASGISLGLILALALQSTVAPFATDAYTPAFPEVSTDLGASAAAVGATLTAFFVGMSAGQLLGGTASDRFGRRPLLLLGGTLCLLGALACALSPTIEALTAARLLQGFGGGMASVVARAVLVDLARGPQLARAMSIMMAIFGIAPVVAPIVGGALLTGGASWRGIFWVLTGLTVAMLACAMFAIPESLPPARRHAGGLATFGRNARSLLANRVYLGFLLVAGLSGFSFMGYLANSTYVLQGMKGFTALQFSLFFAATAVATVLVSLLNARLVLGIPARRLLLAGLLASALGVALLAVSVFLAGLPLVPVCVGFFIVMAAQGSIFGNSGALAADQARHLAGTGAALLGVCQGLAMSLSAPLATAGGTRTAAPMAIVMIVGISLSLVSALTLARPRSTSP
ncbi:multidrug effflux MFS transporter [Micrococcales bacterium 31B]|nr:multidrug effflux MFS transporter [Micrococcales bacterium 31B]